MEPGMLRALTGMYRQLRRAFKVSGCLGSWWRATNGILQRCPLSVNLINLLTTVWKMKIDEMRRHVLVTTRVLPPIHGDQPDMVVHRGAGRAALCPTGYADDTQAMTRTSQDRQDVCDRTAECLRVTGQDVRPDKSGASGLGVTARLRGLEIPNKDEFRQLGVGIRIEAWRGTGPLIRTWMDCAKAILRRIGCIPVLRQQATALGPWCSPRLYGVQSWLKWGRPTCGRWTPSLQLRYGPLREFLGTAKFCGRCSRLDTVLRPHGGHSTNGCCGWRKHPLPPARCRYWCKQCQRSVLGR